jgi:hexokinase
MATLPNFQQENPQAVFDILDNRLSLEEDSLVALTKAFLHEFKLGLQNYGQPMSMM